MRRCNRAIIRPSSVSNAAPLPSNRKLHESIIEPQRPKTSALVIPEQLARATDELFHGKGGGPGMLTGEHVAVGRIGIAGFGRDSAYGLIETGNFPPAGSASARL